MLRSFSELSETLRSFSDFCKNLKAKTDTEEFLAVYNEFGWADELPLIYFFDLQAIFKASGESGIIQQLIKDVNDEKFLERVEQSIRDTVILKNRSHILLKAMERHRNGDYISSIPLLLSQIEGMLWDMGQAKGLVEKIENGTAKIDKNENRVLNKENKPERWRLPALAKELFGDNSKLAMKSSEIYSEKLRHMVLHGRRTDYDSDFTSAILVLMLFVIIQKFKRIQINRTD